DGDTVEDIGQMLKEKGVIKYPWLFKFYCKFTESEDKMDPGNYVLYYNYDYHALVGGMVKRSPNRITVRLTIPEGYTAARIFSLMESKGVCTVEELEDCASKFEFDYWFLEDVPYGSPNRLEGFLFPDTYDFYENDDPDRVLDKLLSNFKKKFSEKAQEQLELLNGMLAERWSAAGYDEAYIEANRFGMYELITVASMIEKETAGVAESGNIASVIYNRLCRPGDYPYLNVDATIVYALGGLDRPLTYDDLEIDSPYNTYKCPGLPAGPIANPGLNSITAALNPSDTNYYYYALDKDTGFHHFSKNAAEHENFLEGQE
ncbi:MAG: endolytic transglycosylase MltG, partial [Oscillospiraceae bacterium]|nr:endolytic transglycosylase MltG [Oscillospiraceae bacterium]